MTDQNATPNTDATTQTTDAANTTAPAVVPMADTGTADAVAAAAPVDTNNPSDHSDPVAVPASAPVDTDSTVPVDAEVTEDAPADVDTPHSYLDKIEDAIAEATNDVRSKVADLIQSLRSMF